VNAKTYTERRLARAFRRLEELRAWRNARECPIPDWQFNADGQTWTLHPGDRWPVVATPVHFRATTRIPDSWSGEPVWLELWLGGEGLIHLSTGLQAGLDPFHHSFPISDHAEGGQELTIEAEVVPKSMFGSHIPEPRIERAHLVVPEIEVRGLERDLTMIAEACRQLGESEVVPLLLDVIDAGFDALGETWPSNTDVVLTRLVRGYVNTIGTGIFSLSPDYGTEAADVHLPFHGLWSMPAAPGELEPLPPAAEAAVAHARQAVAAGLERVKRDYPPIGRLALTGHAHIDLAWLWPLAETRRKARRTFSSVLMLMERYQDFTFNQSSAQLYAWVEQDDPALYARILARIKEGRWEPVGGSWTEPDCQITGGEAFVRQLFYGQRYFQQKLGVRASVAWLPDVFGFAGAIPQILLGVGIPNFFTIKLTWNEANQFPYDLFEWEGIDGSVVTTHLFDNPGHGYNGNIAPLDTLGTWRNFRGKRFHDESLLAFGWGDGGGGPTFKELENYQRLKDFPLLPRLRMAHVDQYFASLPNEGLPRWVGELYLEYHRGTLTTQAKTKALNRAAEHRLVEAEAFGAVAHLHGAAYPHDALEAAWKTLLLNQFHDILPGSSIHEVYQDNHRLVGGVVETATQARDAALAHLGELVGAPAQGEGQLVANASLWPRPLTVTLAAHDGQTPVRDADGTALPTQATEGGLLVHAPQRRVPPLGWTRLVVGGSGPASAPSATVHARSEGNGAVIENDLLRVEIGADGTLARVFDKAVGREALVGRGNQIWAYVDKPRTFDAWDIDEDYENEAAEVGGVERIAVVEQGPLRGAVRVERTWRSSRIVQTYRLLSDSRRLDIDTYIDWHERMMLLKARFPLAVHAQEATYETMFGVIHRPTHRNTSWEAAKFEVSAHRFADLSEPDYGVALLNNGKYGHSAHTNVLTLSLVRGPIYPDPLADEGEHRFIYSLLPHAGDWTDADVTQEAYWLNSPLTAHAVQATANGAALPAAAGFLTPEGLLLALAAMKWAEDGNAVILRLYEPHGARGEATLRFNHDVARVQRVNLLEEAVEGGAHPTVEGNAVRLVVRPFELLTLRVELKG